MARIVLLRWPGLLSARAQSQVAEIEQALEQHQLRDHHRRLIRYSLSHMAKLEQQILDLDRDMQAKIQQAGLEPAWELLQSGSSPACWILACMSRSRSRICCSNL